MSDDPIARLSEEAAIASAEGRRSDAVRLWHELVPLLAATGERERAIGLLLECLEDVDGRRSVTELGRDLYALGRVAGPDDARSLGWLSGALRAFEASNDTEWVARAARVLTAAHMRHRQWAQASEVAVVWAEAAAGDDRSEAVRHLAMARQLSGDVDGAASLLRAELSRADLSGAAYVAAALQLHGLGLGDAIDTLADVALRKDPASALWVLLRRSVERAARGAWAEAEGDARRARSLALEAPDPVGYLMSCLALSEILEAGDARVEAITVVYTCRASLMDLLGEEAGTPLLAVVAGMERRWGAAAFAEVMARYRAQFD
jgi:hypothetical protein